MKYNFIIKIILDTFHLSIYTEYKIMVDKDILYLVSDNIHLARLQKQIFQEKLAEMINISTKYLNMIENRKANPTIVIVIRICMALDIDLNTVWSK